MSSSPTDRAFLLSPDRNPRPLAVPALVLWLQAAGAALAKNVAAESPVLFAHAAPSGLTGLVEGTVIIGAGANVGKWWIANASGVPVQQVTPALVGDLADLDTADQTDIVAAINEVFAATEALAAENADCSIPINLLDRIDMGGVWTLSRTGAGLTRLRRTAGASVDLTALRAYPRVRSASGRGFKATGYRMVYSVSTAALNEVSIAGSFAVPPATGNATAAATSLGAVTYDADHDSSAERKATGFHTMVGTFAAPVYLNAGCMHVELALTVDGTLTGVFDLMSLELLGAETVVDGE